MSQFYSKDVFENNFRYFSHLVVLLVAAENSSEEQVYAKAWGDRISNCDRPGPLANLTRTWIILYDNDHCRVRHHWKELGRIPGFFSSNELENDPICYRDYLRNFYADTPEPYHLVSDLVRYPSLSGPLAVRLDLDVLFESCAAEVAPQ